MASELKPCPFCGYALSIDEGICPIPDAVDEDTGEWKFTGICCPSCAVFLPKQREDTEVSEGVEAWNTRPAPVATDTGLETVAQAYVNEDGECEEIAWIEGLFPHPECIQLVTRSQAEELLAAERAKKKELNRLIEVLVKADAAKDARINFLERIWKKAESRAEALEAKLDTANALVTCCCGDPVDAHNMGSGHSPVDQYHYAMMQLEAKLAAAEKALEPFANIAGEPWADENGWTDAACQNDRIVDWFGPSAFLAARAVLGGKPS